MNFIEKQLVLHKQCWELYFTCIHNNQTSNIRLEFRFALVQSFYTFDMLFFHLLYQGEGNIAIISLFSVLYRSNTLNNKKVFEYNNGHTSFHTMNFIKNT